MGLKKELASINHFIDNFDPQEFTTGPGFLDSFDDDLHIIAAKKLKARLNRRRQMDQRFLSVDLFDEYDASDVMITQEIIDDLLCKI